MTIFGWDMSHYDAPDIGNAISQGISFITHKIGGDRNDPEAAAWWRDVRGERNKVLVGGYWVLLPGQAAQRADWFVRQLDEVCYGWRDAPFILQIDCEKWRNDESTVPSISEINQHCYRLRQLAPKLMPIVYAPEWVYGASVSRLSYPLWASSYVPGSGSFKTLYPGDSSARWGSYGGKTPAILQYSSKATIGGQTTCDANAYRGTLAELTALLAPGWTNRQEIDDMADLTKDNLDAIAKAVWDFKITDYADTANPKRQLGAATWLGYSDDRRNDVLAAVNAGVAKTLAAIGVHDVDESALAASVVQGVLAGMVPQEGSAETIADAVVRALPAELAQQVAQQVLTLAGQRLADAGDSPQNG